MSELLDHGTGGSNFAYEGLSAQQIRDMYDRALDRDDSQAIDVMRAYYPDGWIDRVLGGEDVDLGDYLVAEARDDSMHVIPKLGNWFADKTIDAHREIQQYLEGEGA
jgi:hypothetical protein